MRLFKHILRKLYHLIAFLSLFFIVSLPVNAEGVTVTYNRLVTTASNLTSGIQCNNTYCVNYDVPVRFDTDFTTLWSASSSKTCNSQATVSGHLAIEGDGELVVNPDWIQSNLLSVYLTTNDNNVSYTCNYSNPNNGHLYYTCFVGSMSSSFNIGYTFRRRTTSTAYTNTTSIAYRSVDINCSSSGAGNTQEVIDNNNFNTDRIINSDNSNTDRIINDNRRENDEIKNKLDENNEKQIESQKVCKYIDKNNVKETGKYFASNGNVINDNTFSIGITGYISLDNNSTLDLITHFGTSYYACFYNTNKNLISCIPTGSTSLGKITIPANTSYMRASINLTENKPTFNICKNGNQSLDDSITGLNDSITDSNIDSSDDTINNLKDKIPTNSVISDLLLLPVRFLQNFVNALGSSCSQFNLGSLYGTNLYMPCINIENYLGSGIWTTIDLIISGLFIYSLRKKFIEIYENLTNLRNGGNEVD